MVSCKVTDRNFFIGGKWNRRIRDDIDPQCERGGDIQPLLRETTFGYPRCWSRK
uniref:Homoserine dehydrogenase family protein n=1 Tax=Solanum tuberosum TaxID=4113 RepID=M1BLZ4_SOLTU